MLPPKIILFSNGAEHVNDIFDWTQNNFHIQHFPLLYQLTSADLKTNISLIILIDQKTNKNLDRKIVALQQKLPKIPLLVMVESTNTADVLFLFRTGVKDVLTFPLKKSEFLKKVKRFAVSPVSSFSVMQLIGAFFYSFRKKTLAFWNLLFKKWSYDSASLGIVPNEAYSKILEENPRSEYDLKIKFLGGLRIEVRGKKVKPIAGKKVNSLLAYLLYSHKKPVHRDILMEKFWGNTSPSSARNSLNVAMHSIRKHFLSVLPQQDLLIYKNECYSINSDLDIITDVEQFTAYWQKGSITEQNQGLENALGAYNKAISLYKGDFMEDMLYEEWCEAERDNLKETFLLILDRQSNFFFNQEGYSVAINICRKMLQKDPCLEEVYRKIIICYKKLGLRDKAIRWCYKCEQSLKEELGVEPSEETLLLFERVRTQD